MFYTYRIETDINRYVSVYVENCPLSEAHFSYKTFWDQALNSSSRASQNQCGRSGEGKDLWVYRASNSVLAT